MNDQFKIAVLGIGGVGGYFGGRLAARYAGSEEAQIFFIARGANERAIAAGGLKIVAPEGESKARPHAVTHEAARIGEVDVLLVCTKTYGLEAAIAANRACIGARTSVLPLLNGVDNAEKIKALLPERDVWNGCAFIVARLDEPGTVKVESRIRLLQFGSRDRSARAKLEKFERLLKDAGIDAELSADIDKTVWEKFIFISPVATLTSSLDANMGGIVATEENRRLLAALIAESAAVARAKKIDVDARIEETTLSRVRLAPADSTSSMHSDFKKKGATELETLTGYVVREARRLGTPAPTYEKFYAELQKRSEE